MQIAAKRASACVFGKTASAGRFGSKATTSTHLPASRFAKCLVNETFAAPPALRPCRPFVCKTCVDARFEETRTQLLGQAPMADVFAKFSETVSTSKLAYVKENKLCRALKGRKSGNGFEWCDVATFGARPARQSNVSSTKHLPRLPHFGRLVW